MALVLGECGAAFYLTGRSVRGGPVTKGAGETVDVTAELVTARQGAGRRGDSGARGPHRR